MTLRSVFNLGLDLAAIACGGILCLAVLFFIGYGLIYKKILKGKKRIRLQKLIFPILFFAYCFIVCGATLLTRENGFDGRVVLIPFLSYRDAWYAYSATTWRYIILNICMFIPVGFFLPAAFPGCRHFYKTYGFSLVFTVLIETLQLITARGVFEADDIINNLWGGMIGYGLFVLLWQVHICSVAHLKRVRQKRKGADGTAVTADESEKGLKKDGARKRNAKKAWKTAGKLFAAQIPLLAAVGFFLGIFMVYRQQPFGNLTGHYSVKRNMKNVELTLDIQLSSEELSRTVYYVDTLTHEEAGLVAENILAHQNTDIYDADTIVYDESMYFYDKNHRYVVVVEYKGGAVHYTDFDALFGEGGERESRSDVKRAEAEAALSDQLGICIPQEYGYSVVSDGTITFYADSVVMDNVMYDGNLVMRIETDGRIQTLIAKNLVYDSVGEYACISEAEAYEMIKSGKFRMYYDGEPEKIVVKQVDRGYLLDSKGFYQPVHLFRVRINDKPATIMIPALKDIS